MIDSSKLRSRIEIVDHELNSVCVGGRATYYNP